MAGTTSKGFPYPSTGDTVDIPGDFAALAAAIDAYLPSGTLATLLATQTLEGKTLKSPRETWTVVPTGATGTINLDVLTQGSVLYAGSATANFTLNVRGDAITTLASLLDHANPDRNTITVVMLNTNGATPYFPSTFKIDGVTVTPKWQNGVTPTAGNANSIDLYAFTIIKTAAAPTYTVLAASVRYA